MQDLTEFIIDKLRGQGADLVGIGDLTGLPPAARYDMPVGISVAVKYPREVILGIADMPTRDYYDQYNLLNDRLDALVTLGVEALRIYGYKAIPMTRAFVAETDYASTLPHKTVATRAGLGWIGKSALLVTKQYGSMVRLSSILTNAPLTTAKPINTSVCGSCEACQRACPADAVTGVLWSAGTDRDDLLDARLCRLVARQRAKAAFGIEITQCGRCIHACPYTQQYLNEGD